MVRRALLAAAGLLPSMAAANSDIAIQDVSPRYMALAPGQSGTMSLNIVNHGPDRADAIPIGTLTAFGSDPASYYPLQMASQPGCGTLEPGGPVFLLPGYHFIAGPLAAGENVRCDIVVTRGAEAANSTAFGWAMFDFTSGPSNVYDNHGFDVGTLTDVALDAEPLRFAIDAKGVAHGLVRLRVRNRGAVAIAPFTVGACTDTVQLPFALNGQVPGGCGANVGHGCFDYGFGFSFPGLPAGQSETCNVAIDGIGAYQRPLTFAVPLTIDRGIFDASTHGSLIDTDTGNDSLYLVLGGAPPEATPTLAPPVRAVIVFGTLLIGLLTLARRRQLQASLPPPPKRNPDASLR